MQSISLRDEVQKALAVQWQQFAQRHPHLAAVIDRTVLVEQATTSLGDDPQFRQAINAASAAGLTAQAVAEIVERFVGGWLGKLL